MPNGIIPVPEFHDPSHSAAKRPSLALRVRARWRRGRLDDALAQGADPATSAALSWRAEQLVAPAERSRLADALVDRLADAGRPEPVTIRPRPQRLEVLRCADDLTALATRLRADQPITVHGAALTARLVDHGKSPLHKQGGQPLRHAIREARLALDPAVSAPQDRATAA